MNKFKILIKNNTNFLVFLSYFIVCAVLYSLFLNNIFNSKFNFWNSDAAIKMFPSRVYISEKLQNGEFPFWTERVFLGYPLYQDIELGVLNPVNIFLIYLFGPVWSLKILHFATYLLGVFSIFFISKKFFTERIFLISIFTSVAFYFSFFNLNHLIHMNMVLVSMLLPVHIYLALSFFEKKNWKFLILQVLLFAYSILLGQPQPFFFNLTIVFFFSYFLSNSFKISIKYFVLILMPVIFLTLYQLLPTFNVFIETNRAAGILKYSWLGNSPVLSLSLIFPYLLGYYQNFQGFEVSGAYSFVETYNYIGVTVFILSIYYLIYGRKDRFYKFYFLVLVFYFLLTYLNNFFDFQIPIYNNFRYWTRAVYVLSFISLFPIGFLLNNREKLKANLNYIYFLILFIFVSWFFQDYELLNYLYQNKFVYLKKIDILIWFLIILLTLLSIKFINKSSKFFKIISYFIVLLLIFDLKYFSSDFIPLRISRYDSEASFKTFPDCVNKRCLFEDGKHGGYEFLIFKTYSPFGYSQFISGEYINYFKMNIKGNLFQSTKSADIREELNLKELERDGFIGILLDNNKFVKFPERNVWLFKDNLIGETKVQREGYFEIIIETPESRHYELNLKYSENFETTVNGKKISLEKSGVFSKLYLEKGENKIKINYFPKDIVKGLILGFSLLSIFLICLKLLKFRIFQK